jgi:GNAT superfamily N-acetyltransferase
VRIPVGYQLGPPHAYELAYLPRIETEAASVFPVEDLAPELREEGLSISFFEKASAAGRVWVVRTLVPPAPVGFAAVTLVDASAHLFEMDVVPAHAGRGLGRALVAEVAEWARLEGFSSVTLTTFRHLPWNAPFYAGLGFSEVPAAELGPELRAALVEEAKHGLDPVKRVAMKLSLRTS